MIGGSTLAKGSSSGAGTAEGGGGSGAAPNSTSPKPSGSGAEGSGSWGAPNGDGGSPWSGPAAKGESSEAKGEASEAMEGDGAPEGEPAPQDEAAEPAPARAPRWSPPPPPARPAAPPGVKLHLAAGRYRLVAEHARGDVAIAYQVQVSVEPLMPGVALDLPVPGRVPIRVATGGTLRLRTTGEADVRCRLFDAAGRLLATSSEVGEDWNCGLAEPVAAGDYRLELESEMVVPGTTRLALAQPAPSDAGPLADGRRYPLSAGVLSATLPPPAGDAVLEVSLEAPAPFSCALDDDQGRLAARAGPSTRCTFFLLPAGAPWRLRAWTLDQPTEVTARLLVRPVTAFSGGALPEGGAGRARLPRPGTWRTAEGVRCLAGAAGLLLPCGPEVSLEAGPVVLAAPGARTVPLDEVVIEPAGGEPKAVEVGPRPRLERQRSGSAAAHLVAVTVAPGQRIVPACRLDGGVHVPTPSGCFAAAGAGAESLLRLVATEPVEARLWRTAVSQPKGGALAAGRHRLEVATGGALLELPAGPVRAELTLPPGAWALLLSGGEAVDLCAPGAALSRCTLTGTARAALLLFAPGERRVEAQVTSLPAPPPSRALAGLHEEVAPLPGQQRWRLGSAAVERQLRVDGAAACTVALDDGARLAACEATIPAGLGGAVALEHGAGPLRLLVAPRGDALALAGPAAAAGTPRRLAAGEAMALSGALVERTLELPAEAVVHVRADRGVCLLASGSALAAAGGLGEGCRLDRLLGAGTHRLLVRGFAGAPLDGTAAWTADPVERLAEGVGGERWLAPGDAQVFRFTLASAGRVGLGLREEAETLECRVSDQAGQPLGEGCQQLLTLEPGTYLLTVRAPAAGPAARYRPVLLGLGGAEAGVPDAYLRDLFQRIGVSK